MSIFTDLQTSPGMRETQETLAGLHLLSDDHTRNETEVSPVVGDTSTDPTMSGAEPTRSTSGQYLLPDSQSCFDSQRTSAVREPSSSHPKTTAGTQPTIPPSSWWLELRTWCDLFEDAQQSRIAAENRARATGVPDIYNAYLSSIRAAEHECELAMWACYRRVAPRPLIRWQKDTPGIGQHLLARLLGHIGHPVIAIPHHWEGTGANRTLVADTPFIRRVSDLWSYCGHGDPARRKQKGMTADEAASLGKPSAKMLVHLLAEGTMKCIGSETRRRSPYRDVYDRRRLLTVERVHTAPCVRCGPSGKPAAEGSPWSAAHQHTDALRIVGKEILRDMWLICRDDTE